MTDSLGAEEFEQQEAKAIQAAERYLEAHGCCLANLLLFSVRFVPKGDDPFDTGRDCDMWLVWYMRNSDPDLHPHAVAVLVDAKTFEVDPVGPL